MVDGRNAEGLPVEIVEDFGVTRCRDAGLPCGFIEKRQYSD